MEIQIMSDLHLEMIQQLGQNDNIPPRAPYLALLGDIGYGRDERLFQYLEAQLRNFKLIFYVLGNHEAYTSSWEAVKNNFRTFSRRIAAKSAKDPGLGQFVLLDKTRYDISDLSILGCTLFSHVPEEHKQAVAAGMNDFRLIQNWTVDAHSAAHAADLAWLNSQVSAITLMEPSRKIVILTHYNPSKDPRTVNPKYAAMAEDAIASAIRTDLRGEECWRNERVRLWAFGHTHFNVDFVDGWTGKRVVANQMGFSGNSEIDWKTTQDAFHRNEKATGDGHYPNEAVLGKHLNFYRTYQCDPERHLAPYTSIVGPSGIDKNFAVQQLAVQHGKPVVDINLGQHDGLPSGGVAEMCKGVGVTPTGFYNLQTMGVYKEYQLDFASKVYRLFSEIVQNNGSLLKFRGPEFEAILEKHVDDARNILQNFRKCLEENQNLAAGAESLT